MELRKPGHRTNQLIYAHSGGLGGYCLTAFEKEVREGLIIPPFSFEVERDIILYAARGFT
ncbi:MAG TPA: hypothetical protein VF762_06180 [Blastocatellia bacterium]|jgi:hypothetical protein